MILRDDPNRKIKTWLYKRQKWIKAHKFHVIVMIVFLLLVFIFVFNFFVLSRLVWPEMS